MSCLVDEGGFQEGSLVSVVPVVVVAEGFELDEVGFQATSSVVFVWFDNGFWAFWVSPSFWLSNFCWGGST